MSRQVTRVVSCLFGLWGAAQLTFPEQLLQAVAPGRPQPPPWLVRVLGARMLVQYGVAVAAPDRPVLAASAAVDGLHAASMLAVAATRARHRRVALISAGVAGTASVAALRGMPGR